MSWRLSRRLRVCQFKFADHFNIVLNFECGFIQIQHSVALLCWTKQCGSILLLFENGARMSRKALKIKKFWIQLDNIVVVGFNFILLVPEVAAITWM